MRKQIIILTKSDKHSGYCVAGIDRDTGEWIRVVSNDVSTEYAVPYDDMFLDDGSFVEVYDIVEIDFLRPVPTDVQPENYLYNKAIRWKKIGESNLEEVIEIHGYDDTEYVFGNDDRRLTEDEIYDAGGSLLLLKVRMPSYFVNRFPERTTFQLNFIYNGVQYSYFNVTDRELKLQYMNRNVGSYPTGTNTFVFSLTDKYIDGKYYKVVAQALT